MAATGGLNLLFLEKITSVVFSFYMQLKTYQAEVDDSCEESFTRKKKEASVTNVLVVEI